jgi:hypothetical protein
MEAEATVAQKMPTAMRSIAMACLTLASDSFSGNTTGQVISVDGGKTGKLCWLEDGRIA